MGLGPFATDDEMYDDAYDHYDSFPTRYLIEAREGIDVDTLTKPEETKLDALEDVLSDRWAGIIARLTEEVDKNAGKINTRLMRAHYTLGKVYARNPADFEFAELHMNVARRMYDYIIVNNDDNSERVARLGEKIYSLGKTPSGLIYVLNNPRAGEEPREGSFYVEYPSEDSNLRLN